MPRSSREMVAMGLSDRERILVVEDDPEIMQLLEQLLASQAYEVHNASTAQRALELLDQHGLEVSLALIDIGLPDQDGITLCRQLKKIERLTDLPVVFLTARDDNRAINDGFDAGGVDYLTKPFGRVELLARIKAHVRVYASLRELREALAELGGIQRDSELLAACANCGQVKTPAGAWKTLEAYLRERVRVELTHSICPSCQEQIYRSNGES
jgi:DNA-binding response OmpR family regulator